MIQAENINVIIVAVMQEKGLFMRTEFWKKNNPNNTFVFSLLSELRVFET